MKKLLLLLAVGSIAMNAGAQERYPVVSQGKTAGDREIEMSSFRQEMRKMYPAATSARKTTAGGSRWYSYSDAVDTSTGWQQTLGGAVGTALAVQTIWKDTNGTVNYTSGLAHNTMVSQANVFDPKARLFNRDEAGAYIGQIEIKSTDAYTCDSVDIFGIYDYNSTKTTFCDTLRLLFTKGNGAGFATTNVFGGGSLGAGGHYGTVGFMDMLFDSVTVKGTGSQTADLHYQDIYLCNSGASPAWKDTLSNGIWARRIAVNGSTGISASAGDMLGWAVTFISGDPATKGAGKLASPTPGDTLVTSGIAGQNKYNAWRPLMEYYATAGTTTATWAPYLESATPTADHNIGLWKTLPSYKNGWDSVYVPMWAWNSGGGASTLQLPVINWHITCSSCGLIPSSYLGVNNTAIVSEVNAVPNPANNGVNITYTLAKNADVNVTMTNIMGQVVATKNVANTASGSVVINTSTMAPGMYMYTLTANGEKTTGRVVVAH